MLNRRPIGSSSGQCVRAKVSLMTTERARAAHVALVDEPAADERHAERFQVTGARAAVRREVAKDLRRLGPRAAVDEARPSGRP